MKINIVVTDVVNDVTYSKHKYGAVYYVSELSPLDVPTVLAIEHARNSHTN